MSEPWFKFYPTDWRADPALKMCSLAARGLWIEMLGIMHDAAQYGHLLVANSPPADADLAVLIGTTPDQISDLLGELESRAVFSRTRKGVIYSRKMVRDAKNAETSRKNGKKGGNPSLCKTRENPSLDNPSDKEGVKPRSQKPEARSQILDDDDDRRDRDNDLGLMELACQAAGRSFGEKGVNGSCFGASPGEADALRRWQSDLHLTPDEIVKSINHQSSKMRIPARSLTYFTPGMQDYAASKSAPPLEPTKGTPHDRPTARDRRSTAADDAFVRVINAAAGSGRSS